MMTLDEAIKHCEEVAKEKGYEVQDCLEVRDMESAMECGKCGEEHRQLAEWLKELKQLREQKSSAGKIRERVELGACNTISKESLCFSCKTKGCMFQSGIVRSHCDFYKSGSEGR